MSTQEQPDRLTLLQGTLDLLILADAGAGPAARPRDRAGDSGGVQGTRCWWKHGALYPALQRLEAQEWIAAEWGISDNNRKARFCIC